MQPKTRSGRAAEDAAVPVLERPPRQVLVRKRRLSRVVLVPKTAHQRTRRRPRARLLRVVAGVIVRKTAKDKAKVRIKVRDKYNNLGRNFQNNLGYFNNGGNNVDQNMQMVALFSTAYGNGHGHGINADNFDRCAALFAARKLVEKNWVNSKDEYLAPNTDHPKWAEFVNDSLIFSIFHSSSNQSSLRNVRYRGMVWDIKNEWFFMPRGAIGHMASDNDNGQCYYDSISGTEERFMCKHIQGRNFSDEASLVLSFGIHIVTETFMFREIFNKNHPEYQVNNWDAGFYQLKAICKEYCPAFLKHLNEVFKRLSDKMRPMVYELGFLK